MERRVEVTTAEQIQRRSGYQALEPVQRPAWADVDLDLSRRPGVVRTRQAPEPFPNTRYPPERQPGEPTAPMHGRPNKSMPPVFGTATPLKGVSGAIRRYAARYPDHEPNYWLLKLLGDRVESWGQRARKLLPFALPLAGIAWVVARERRAERHLAWRGPQFERLGRRVLRTAD